MSTKKDDRGMNKFIGETIIKVDPTAINVVRFITASGKILDINCDVQHHGIGILECTDETNSEIPKAF